MAAVWLGGRAFYNAYSRFSCKSGAMRVPMRHLSTHRPTVPEVPQVGIAMPDGRKVNEQVPALVHTEHTDADWTKFADRGRQIQCLFPFLKGEQDRVEDASQRQPQFEGAAHPARIEQVDAAGVGPNAEPPRLLTLFVHNDSVQWQRWRGA